nr:dnaJ homolog subfamily B member 6-like isoform X1 [Symphalangus syndactylus]
MAGPAGGGRRGNRAVPMATLRPGARGWGRRSISRPRPVLGGLRGPRLRAWGGLDRREGSGISSPRCGWGRGGGSRLGVRPGRGFHPGGVWTRPRRRVAKVRPTERSTSQIGKNQAKYDHDARIKTATNREGLPQRSLPPAAGTHARAAPARTRGSLPGQAPSPAPGTFLLLIERKELTLPASPFPSPPPRSAPAQPPPPGSLPGRNLLPALPGCSTEAPSATPVSGAPRTLNGLRQRGITPGERRRRRTQTPQCEQSTSSNHLGGELQIHRSTNPGVHLQMRG